MKLISVVMSVYNEEPKWLEEAIDSILSQTYPNFEFIIVLDNHNNEILKNILLGYKASDSRIKLLINEKNMGLIYSLNEALKECKGEYIARMDADDISHKNRFEKQLKYLENNGLDLVGSNVNYFTNSNEIFYETDRPLTQKYISKLLISGMIAVVHPTFFAKREVYDKLDGYNNALHGEDIEFLARVMFYGFKVGNTKEVLLGYRYRNSSVTKINAYFSYKTAEYCSKVFKKSLKTGKYIFNDNYINNFMANKKERDNFNKKQILMVEARKELNNKKYISFILTIIKACFYSKSVFFSIKINLILKLYKFMENLEFKKSNKNLEKKI